MIGQLVLLRNKTDILHGLMKGGVWEWIAFVVSLVAIVISIWLIVRVRTWLRGDDGHAALSCELLDPLRELKEQGHLSEEEIRLINSRRMNSEKSTPDKK